MGAKDIGERLASGAAVKPGKFTFDKRLKMATVGKKSRREILRIGGCKEKEVENNESPTGLFVNGVCCEICSRLGLIKSDPSWQGVAWRESFASSRRLRHLTLEERAAPASESYFNDLIEILWQLRWKIKGNRLISSETKALLDYLRALRNGRARPPSPRSQIHSLRKLSAFWLTPDKP